MGKVIKSVTLVSFMILVSGCSFPFQKEEYPAWNTKGIIDSTTLLDERVVDGWQGLDIGHEAVTSNISFIVRDVEFVDSYEGYEANEGKVLVHATIQVNNNLDVKQYLSKEDFALMWNLEKTESSYAYSLNSFTDDMLVDNLVIPKDENIIFNTVYEIDNTIKKPMAIFYGETYKDGVDGNSFYVYIR